MIRGFLNEAGCQFEDLQQEGNGKQLGKVTRFGINFVPKVWTPSHFTLRLLYFSYFFSCFPPLLLILCSTSNSRCTHEVFTHLHYREKEEQGEMSKIELLCEKKNGPKVWTLRRKKEREREKERERS
jgi:hypothetical protein